MLLLNDLGRHNAGTFHHDLKAETEDDDDPFAEDMACHTAILDAQFAESALLEAAIRENVRALGSDR